MKASFLKTTLLAAVTLVMVAPSSDAGWIKRYLYGTTTGPINGVLVTDLLADPRFPGSPDETQLIPPAPTPPLVAEGLDNPGYPDYYGSYLPGYIEPPETGNYIFWVYGDDETQLWLTSDPTDPLNPAKKQMICSVPGWSNAREWTKYPEQQSAQIYLEKGKQYYMEILHKEGGGGDRVGWGWQLPSGIVERPMFTFYLQPTYDPNDTTVVNGPYIGVPNPISPYDFNVYDGMEVALYADLNLTPPYTVQWRREAADIPGATQTYYRFRARVSDSGTQFYIRVNGTLYGPVTLNVYADVVRPELVSATTVPADPTRIQLVFSEEVTAATATNLSNYTLNTATIQSATLQPDGRTVLLKTTLLDPNRLNTLTISGIQDMAQPPNTISVTTTNFIVADGAISFRFWDFRPTDLPTLRRWSSPYSTAPSYTNNMFIEQRTVTSSSYPWSLVPSRDNYSGQLIGYLIPPETGYYKFAIASDDHSILYLGTNEQRASKREVCYYNGATGQWNTGAQLANQQSGPIWLEAGKPYYFEAVFRDGTGGDGVSVFWQTPSGPPLPTTNQSVQAVTQPFLIPTNCLATFDNPPALGGLTFRFWDTTPTSLAELRTWSNTNSVAPSYTNNMFIEERTITTTSYQWNLVPLHDNYQGQMIGYLTAPETGNYKFAIASDDHSILYLGTSDQRASKREICRYDGSTGRWNVGAQLANQQSALIPLEAGKRYYIEAVYRDGTGGDGVSVFWQTPSGPPLPTANESVQANTEPFLIPARYLSTFNTFGNVFLATDLPATLTAPESTRPTLRVVADGTRPYGYTWYKNGEPIPGATGPSYTLPFLRASDNNAQFAVVVTNNFSSYTSAVTTVTVTPDNTPPSVVSVGSLYKQLVEVWLSEPVTADSAANPANYLLLTSAGATVAVTAATQDPADASHVTLQTAPMPETDLMRLVTQNLVDLSAGANVMTAQTNTFKANNFDALVRINNAQAYRASAAGSTIGMTGGGSDIWGTADQFVFLFKTNTGNFDYKVQGLSLPPVNQWCKMGIMARPSTNADARNAFVAFTPLSPAQNTYTPQIRDVTAGTSSSSADAGTPLNLNLQPGVPAARPTVVYPSWVRLQRIGNIFYYYYGNDGTNWIYWTAYDSSASAEGPLPDTLLVGLALTSHDTARTVDGTLGWFTAVDDGPLFFALQPTNATVVENGSVTFYAAAGGSTPWFYQWLRNGVPIDGATNASYTLARASYCTDHNVGFACRISNGYGQTLTSTNAILTVIQDTVPPTVAYYTMPKINLNPNEVKLLFSEPVAASTAQNTANYQIFATPANTPLAVTAATLQPDERTVALTTADQTPGTTYRVVVNGVTDLACSPPNPVAPNSTDYFFYAGAAPQFKQRDDGYIIMEAENFQENIVAADGDEWLFSNTNAAGGGFSGAGYMFVPNGRGGGSTTGTSPNLSGTGAKLVFHLNMTRTGRHIVWIRGWVQDTANPGNDDSVYVGFNNTVGLSDPAADYLVAMSGTANQSSLSGFLATGWQWRSDRQEGSDPFTFTNTTTGLHRFIIWHREDGTLIDKIIIEAGNRAAGTTAAPAPCTANGGLGEPETWDFIAQPPGPLGIVISSPTNSQTFPANTDIPVTATITGPTPVVLVEFFVGTNLLGTATTAPYTITWPNVPEGIYSLTARVTDGLGYQATSPAVQVVVDSTKPVAYAVGSLHGASIGVYFADLSGLDPVSATNVDNYIVNGGAVAVTEATLEPDNLAVMLALAQPISGQFSVQVRNVTDRGFGPNVVDTVTLQSSVVTWPLNQDVGTVNTNPPPPFTDPLMSGFVQAIGTDGFYVRAGGHDIWDAADGMHFVYLPVTGDFDVKVRVAGVRLANVWSKAGLMIREDLEGNSRNHMILATPTNGVNVINVQWRATKGGASASLDASARPPSPIPNAWLRLTRTGTALNFYWATNGTDWVNLRSEIPVPPYPDQVYVGLATTSHDNTSNLTYTTSAYYRDLTGLPPAAPPTLSVALSGSQVTISWSTSESGVTLQFTDTLTPPNWQPVTTPPVVNGQVYTVTVPVEGSQRYFRLVRQ
mgnify:CR=1 FL=1